MTDFFTPIKQMRLKVLELCNQKLTWQIEGTFLVVNILNTFRAATNDKPKPNCAFTHRAKCHAELSSKLWAL